MNAEQPGPFLQIKRNLSGLVDYLDKINSNEQMEISDLNRRFDEVIQQVGQAFDKITRIDFSVSELSYALEDICDFLRSIKTNHYFINLIPRPQDLFVVNNFSELYGRIGPDFLYRVLLIKQDFITQSLGTKLL